MSSSIIQKMRDDVPQEVIDEAVSKAVSKAVRKAVAAEQEASKKAITAERNALALNMLKAGSSGTFILQCIEKMTRTNLEKLAAENGLSVVF